MTTQTQIQRPATLAGIGLMVLGAGVVFATAGIVHVGVDSLVWRRFIGGGHLRGTAVLPLPGLRRLSGARVAVDARTPITPDAALDVSVDGDPPSRVSPVPHGRDWRAVPARALDGAAISLRPEEPLAVDGIWVAARPEWARAAAWRTSSGPTAGRPGLVGVSWTGPTPM